MAERCGSSRYYHQNQHLENSSNIMDHKEMTLSLRIINKLIKGYSKTNLTASAKEGSMLSLHPSMLTSDWLMNLRNELNDGKCIKLSALVAKIRSMLEECFRGMEPLLVVFHQVLLTEQSLECEIKRLPRNLQLECNGDKAKHKKMKKGAPKNLVLQSKILTNIIKRMEDSISSDSSDEVENTGDRDNTFNSAAAPKRKAGRSPMIKKGGNRTINENADKNKQSADVITTDESKPIKNKTSAVKQENSTKLIESVPRLVTNVRALRNRTILMQEDDITDKNQTESQTERLKVTVPKKGIKTPKEKKQKTSHLKEMNKKNLTLFYENIRVTVKEEKEIDKESKHIKLLAPEEMCKTFSQSSIDITKSEYDPEMNEVIKNDFEGPIYISHPKPKTFNSELESELSFSTIVLEKILPKSSHYEDLKASYHETEGKAVPLIKSEESYVKNSNQINVNDSTSTKERNLQQGTELPEYNNFEYTGSIKNMTDNQTLQQLKTEAFKQELKPESKRKRNSKFVSKGNQLMGIKDEESEGSKVPKKIKLSESVDDAMHLRNNVNICSVNPTVESSDQESLKNTSNCTVSDYNSRKSAAKTKQTKNESEVVAVKKTHGLASNQNNIDESIPEVLKVIKKQKRLGRKILVVNDKNKEDSEVTVEKIILNETLDDDDEKPEDGTKDEILHNRKYKNSDQEKTLLSGGKNVPKTLWTKKKCYEVIRKEDKEVDFNSKKTHMIIPHEKNINGSKSPIGNAMHSFDLHANDDACTSKKIIDEERKQMAELWEMTILTPPGDKFEELIFMAEIPEISCFLHLCQKTLRIPFFTHFEFERALLIPHVSCLMAAIVTALLSGAPTRKEAKSCSPLPYLEWNRKLTARISHWFLIQKRLKSYLKVYDLIGVEPIFWEILASERNPLCLKPFHQLPIHHQVTILKGLCDHLFHVSKRIQTALMSTPRNGREVEWLGEDAKGARYLFFPIFLHHGIGDLRIYQMTEEQTVDDEINETQEEVICCSGKADTSHTSNPEISNEGLYFDETFRLVAHDIHTLNELMRNICSAYSEEEITEAEEKLCMKKSKADVEEIRNEECEKECVNREEEETMAVELDAHLLLAARIRTLAKDFHPLEDCLNKSRTAALVKLYSEWTEFNKVFVSQNNNTGHRKKKITTKTLVENGKKPCESSEMTHSDNNEKQPSPRRISLSRKAKCNAGNQILNEGNRLSRKTIVAKMEEDALMGCSKVLEEDLKWDTSLWADEESEDSGDDEEAHDENFIWHGYAAVQNDKSLKAMTTTKRKWLSKKKFKKTTPKFNGHKKGSLESTKRVPIIKLENNNDKISMLFKDELANQDKNVIETISKRCIDLKTDILIIKKEETEANMDSEEYKIIKTEPIPQNIQESLFGNLSSTPIKIPQKINGSSGVKLLVIKKAFNDHTKPQDLAEYILKSFPKVKQDLTKHGPSIDRPVKILQVPRSQMKRILEKGKIYLPKERESTSKKFAETETKVISNTIEKLRKDIPDKVTEKHVTYTEAEGDRDLIKNNLSDKNSLNYSFNCALNQSTITEGPCISLEQEQTGCEGESTFKPSLIQSTNTINTEQISPIEAINQSSTKFKPFPFKSRMRKMD